MSPKRKATRGEPLNLTAAERAALPKIGKAGKNARNVRGEGKAPSPMRRIEHAVGPNPDGQADAARAAHTLPVVPTTSKRKASSAPPPPMNTPPSSSPSTSAVDSGQE